jgi:hypothetical protein
MEYNDQDKAQKECKCAQAQRLPRGAAGAAFGNPAHLLDAANYVQCAWDAVTSTTISNAWRKAELFPTLKQDDDEEDAGELDDGMFDEILQELSKMNIAQQEINEFPNSDNENSLEYIDSIMEDVNDIMHHATIESSDDENDETEAAQRSDDEQVSFVGLDALYDHMLVLEDQLLCKGFQDKMGEKYDKIISPFLVCLGRLREVTMDDKRQRVARMRQSKLHDAWNT